MPVCSTMAAMNVIGTRRSRCQPRDFSLASVIIVLHAAADGCLCGRRRVLGLPLLNGTSAHVEPAPAPPCSGRDRRFRCRPMSRRVCHLHVGTGKTGSSALQSAFAAERDRLRSHRLAYPDLSGTMAMALAGMPTAGNARDVVVALRRGDVGAAVDLVARHADAEHDIVLSAEGLSGFGEATLAAFAAGLHGLGYDTRALMFARPHTEWVVSAWLQQVKPGRTTSDLVAFTRNWMSPERLASERSHSGRARTLERAIGDLIVHWYPAVRRQGPRGVIEAGFR